MILKILHIALISITLVLSTHASVLTEYDTIKLLTTKTEFVAGDTVVLSFSVENNKKPLLYIINSFGSTLIKPEFDSNIAHYNIPDFVSSKSGVLSWKLLTNDQQLQGKIKILPKQDVATIQTYLGPPSIVAGGKDYSMLVSIPTDVFDNPLADSTKVAIKHLCLNNLTVDSVFIKNRISYKNVYSPFKVGRIIMSSGCLGINSKEYDVSVLPSVPTDFTINYERHHNYADGNQITNFITSVIKDEYGNLVSDGTFVQFFIHNTSNTILKTSGTTINGIATAKMIHPDHQDIWKVTAFIEGMAESNSIELNYKSVISNFEVHLYKNNRNINIGPLKSFMNQMIPDGLEVTLSVYKKNTLIKTLYKSSSEGYANFNLKPDQFPNNTYTLKIKAAGIVKTYPNTKLW